METLTLFALLGICIMSYFLIITEDYDAGVIGHLALAGLSFAGGVGFAQQLCGKVYFDPVSQIMFVSTSIFELRHIYRIYKGKTHSRDVIETFRRILN